MHCDTKCVASQAAVAAAVVSGRRVAPLHGTADVTNGLWRPRCPQLLLTTGRCIILQLRWTVMQNLAARPVNYNMPLLPETIHSVRGTSAWSASVQFMGSSHNRSSHIPTLP